MRGVRTIYAAMTGGFGSLAQVAPILERLDRRRYRVVCSIAHGAAEAARALGFEFVPYPEVAPPRLVTPAGRVWWDLDLYWGRLGFAAPEYAAAVVESRLRLVRSIAPDALLTQFCPPTELMARITGLPLICVTQSCWHPRGRPVGWWMKGEGEVYARVTPSFNTVLERYGAAPITRAEDLNQGDLTLLPSFPELDPVSDEDAVYLGPLTWESAETLAPGAPSLSGRPLVVVYTGHLTDSGGRSGGLLLERCLGAFAGRDVDVLVATGLGQGEIDPQPAQNIQVRPWLPLRRLLQRAELFVHHGGHGSCVAGLQAGVPMLVLPTFQERAYNARQLEALGVGTFLDPVRVGDAELWNAARSCMADVAILARVRWWRSELLRRGYGGAALAVERIDTLMAR